jgi:hypothetical protein
MSSRASANRARFDGSTLVLPGFSLFNAGGRVPNRHRLLASHTSSNGVVFSVEANWPRTKWWASASKQGYRMSNTAATGNRAVAEKWIAAVTRGDVTTGRWE